MARSSPDPLSDRVSASPGRWGPLAPAPVGGAAVTAELRERELIKLASLSSALAGALRQRGVSDAAASLTAEAGIAVFRIAVERWVDEANERTLPDLVRASLDELKAVTAGR